MKNPINIPAVATAALLATVLNPSTSAVELDINLSTALSNRYVTEGINNDPDSSGYAFTEVTVEAGGFLAGVWYAQSLRGSAENEVNIFAQHDFALGPLGLFAGLNYLTFPAPDEPDTWEVYFGIEYPDVGPFVLYGETYYDFDEVKGGFLELGVALPLLPQGFNDQLEVTPYAQIGVDYGFV